MPVVKPALDAADVRCMWNRRDRDAGRSTRAYYETRLRAWRRANRALFVATCAMVAPLAVPLWLYVPLGKFYAGVLIGSLGGMITWIRDDPPEFIAKWKRGAAGEEQTARELRRLERFGWHAVHDRTTGRGNLDHVAVGPGGLFLLESKNLNGTIRVDEAGLTAVYGDAAIDAFTNTRLRGAVIASAISLKERVAEVTRRNDYINAVVVIWGHFPQGLVEKPNVTFIAGERLSEWLRARPERLSRRDVNLIRLAFEGTDVAPPAPALDAASA